MSETILITGASTGFGHDTARTLAHAGHTVFASMREPQAKNREHAEALRRQGIQVVELDVTAHESVERAVKEVLRCKHSARNSLTAKGKRPAGPRIPLDRSPGTPMIE